MKEKPVILLGDGAKDIGLAEMIFHLIRQNLTQKPQKLPAFKTLHSNVAITAEDIDLTITLIFERGKLTLFNGLVKKPDLEIIADRDTILELSLINFFRGIPNYFDRVGQRILKKLILGNLKIRGMFSHPFQLICLSKVFSVN